MISLLSMSMEDKIDELELPEGFELLSSALRIKMMLINYNN